MEEQPAELLDTSNINRRVYELLKKRIINLTYTPGQRINPRGIANELGISYTPIKDALIMLAGEGWVEINSRRGTYVTGLFYQDVAEVIDIMILLETSVVEEFGEQITQEQMEKLESAYEAVPMEDVDVDYTEFIEKINELHREIVSLAKNKTLLAMFDQLNTHNRILRYRFARQVWERPASYHQNYKEIMKALETQDPERAKVAIREHFLSMKQFFLEKVATPDT